MPELKPPTLRVVLADDHTIVRKGIRGLLRQLPDVEVVAEASDGREALEIVRTLRPDLVLMDITMPGMNGLEATVRIARESPGTRVLILSMHASEEYVAQALRAGAAGYVLKDADLAELEAAVRALARGDSYLTPAVSKRVVQDYLRRVTSDGSGIEVLTPRQREIVQLVAEGHSTKEIARRLELSVKTVEAHRGEIMNRLGIHDVAGVVRWAIRAGVVSPDR